MGAPEHACWPHLHIPTWGTTAPGAPTDLSLVRASFSLTSLLFSASCLTPLPSSQPSSPLGLGFGWERPARAWGPAWAHLLSPHLQRLMVSPGKELPGDWRGAAQGSPGAWAAQAAAAEQELGLYIQT